MIAYITTHWVEWIFAALMAALGWGYKNVSARLKKEQLNHEAIAEGVQALLRESIVENYNRYTDKGFCPIYAKESVKKVYKAYHNLGGNDVATELYQKLLRMEEEEHDKQSL